MKEDFAELIEVLKKNRKYGIWAGKVTSDEYVKNVAEEAEEVVNAVRNKDNANLEEELGDLLWDSLMLAIIAEEEGKISTKNIIRGVINKMKERKPHIFEERFITKEESDKVWNEAKAKQKARKGEKNG